MIPAKIFRRDGNDFILIKETEFPDLPTPGSLIGDDYKIISIGFPIPVGTNLSANEPEMGARILVEKLP